MADTITNCPHCQQEFSIDPATLGRQFQCVKCGQTFTATEAAPAEIQPMAVEPVPTLPPTYVSEPPPGHVPTSRVAVASLLCGLLCWVWPVSVAALVTGIIGITKTRNYRMRGNGMAITGVVLGGIGLVADPVLYLMIAVIIPALSHARNIANATKSKADLRQIGIALIAYQNQNGGANPPDLETLISSQGLSTALFVYPASTDTPASSASTLESGGHLSYVYIGAGQPISDSASLVVLYESGNGHLEHTVRGINVLFGDGSVMFEPRATADHMIQTTRQQMGLPKD